MQTEFSRPKLPTGEYSGIPPNDPLADGSIAAGLYNKSLAEQTIVLDMEALGILCKWTVRDVWFQQDEGVFLGRYETSVPGHASHPSHAEGLRQAPRGDGRHPGQRLASPDAKGPRCHATSVNFPVRLGQKQPPVSPGRDEGF